MLSDAVRKLIGEYEGAEISAIELHSMLMSHLLQFPDEAAELVAALEVDADSGLRFVGDLVSKSLSKRKPETGS